ncbi:MAG: tetratricopeptide repeat protein [Desulfobulbaceae bacterium]|nr:tetratricopeptide repeat protein [Desulfobulbaceae bacterium]HIJ79831.1 tetratricopeptide repeat protein [Deltaproteobacteria bacterium]
MNNYPTHILTILVALLSLILNNACVQRPQPEQTPVTIQVAELKLSSGINAFEQGNYYGAKIQFNDALTLYRSLDHGIGMAQAHLNLAKTYLDAGNLQSAADHLQRSRELAGRENITELSPHLEIMASSLAIKEKQWQQALTILAPYLPTTTRATHDSFTLAALQNRIIIAFATEPSTAGHWVTQLAEILNHNGKSQPALVARLFRFQALLAQQQGDRSGRDQRFNAALKIYRDSTARPGIAATLYEWAMATLTSGQHAEAEDLFQRALTVRFSMQDHLGCIEIMEQLPIRHGAEGDRAEKLKYWLSVLRQKELSQLPALLPARFSLREIITDL